MRIGIIGIGRMGNAIAQRLVKAGHDVIGYDPNEQARGEAASIGIQKIVTSALEVAHGARTLWLMIPAGELVDATLHEIMPALQKGDIIIDGGNSHYLDSMRRAKMLAQKDIFFLDCGTSGGLQGRELGFSLMVGGDQAAYDKVHSFFIAIAAPDGVGLVGPSGAGHYVKMVHNGIEYALLQSYAEGFQLIKEGSFKNEELNLEKISFIWKNGSVIRSWILKLAHDVFSQDQKFSAISGAIEESGTGKWAVQEANAHKVQVHLIEESLKIRAWSRDTGGNYGTKIVAMLRHAFGGHAVNKGEEPPHENI